MIAEYITVTSRKAGKEKSYTWHSDGLREYTVADTDREFSRGIEVLIHVKEKEDEYLDHFRLKNIVKSYSDHIAIPNILY
jgi:molecular chaperone HtpG